VPPQRAISIPPNAGDFLLQPRRQGSRQPAIALVLIAGDAAHINSPIGGVGLNSGIHDVLDAAARILRIRSGGGDPEAELSTFDAVRRRVAVEYVQADTQRNTERLKETDDARRRATHEEMRAIAADPDRARAYMRRVSLLESVRRFGIGRPPGHDRIGVPA
jgi:2-polyprenyl-6-methoxyphenol hydroxylase-like FAD-dependent oxidoreductase